MKRKIIALLAMLAVAASATAATTARSTGEPAPWDPHRGVLIAGATVVTMDDRHTVIPFGNVLVRDGSIVAVWAGPSPPRGVSVGNASVIRAGLFDLVFPGLINLHDHPFRDVLPTWLPPSSHALPAQGKAGTDPYANRYQWGAAGSPTSPPEKTRLIDNPAAILGTELGLGLLPEVNKYAEAGAVLGGETADVGVAGALVRAVDGGAFGGRVAPSYAGPIAALGGTDLTDLRNAMAGGLVDAWMVHLAEGVRDGDRRPGDMVSSRAELQTLKANGLLTDMTVVVHGTGLERPDFAELRSAPTVRTDGVGDGRGAKLVWSPLSNLLLYGETTDVYGALAEGVLVSLGTDWTPSGSRSLLHELKVADVALRDWRVLGGSRDEVPALSTDGKPLLQRLAAEATLDETLVDMVTRNPAKTLHWYDRVGSIEAGKAADLILVHGRWHAPPLGVPPSVYRALIDADESDVRLVLVGGEPRAGDVPLLAALKPGDTEVIENGALERAIDATTATDPEPLAELTSELQAGLTALGGDHPPAGGGPGPPGNTYGYLKAHVAGGAAAGLPDAVFNALLAAEVGVLPDGSLNLERMQLDPLVDADDDFLAHVLHGDLDPSTGLVADPTPPYRLYPANLNHVGPAGNPLRGVS